MYICVIHASAEVRQSFEGTKFSSQARDPRNLRWTPTMENVHDPQYPSLGELGDYGILKSRVVVLIILKVIIVMDFNNSNHSKDF